MRLIDALREALERDTEDSELFFDDRPDDEFVVVHDACDDRGGMIVLTVTIVEGELLKIWYRERDNVMFLTCCEHDLRDPGVDPIKVVRDRLKQSLEAWLERSLERPDVW